MAIRRMPNEAEVVLFADGYVNMALDNYRHRNFITSLHPAVAMDMFLDGMVELGLLKRSEADRYRWP